VGLAPLNIVEKEFWENDYYWSDVRLPCRADPAVAFDRSLARALATHAPAARGERVVEVGCAPAKWLIFYAERFGARPSGIEYSAKGARLSRENLTAAGVVGEIHEADFFEAQPSPHELVVSIGFVEHFDDPVGVLRRHLDFLAPGGRLAVGVPNFRGLNGALQWLADPAYLELHRRTAMTVRWHREFARAGGLELAHLGYLGGFDPSIIRLGARPLYTPARAIPGAVTLLERRFRALSIAERLEHRWLSSYLLAVYRKPGAAGTPARAVRSSAVS